MAGGPVVRIDHINIRTDRFEETCIFYEKLLVLDRGSPPGLDPDRFAWLRNGEGEAIVHVASLAKMEASGAGGTGLLHHVAFTCSGYADWRERIDAMSVACEVNDFPAAGLRQLFVPDPNGILLEFNFYTMPLEALIQYQGLSQACTDRAGAI